ncbi:transcriptional regulator [Paeniglutamicibacter kerguelensis]|uniref:DNA-binding MarR family transcriptional regulator n=1 Tax=Paeniglutamicibacter kerguelensis TaxID=254788 RepID=A0ABS4XHZ2_9MICC|nr:transcriptional regulator [Paeniglutamicibacter kerguelensis]MBP2388093.1 DNA-binding MarR family transcriptional regulator [Paeniglutamicibacter kerguelensis]
MAELDPVIHADARLRVMSALNTLGPHESVAFPKLREILGMTAGNLSTHLRKLEDAGYISQQKVIEGRSPATYLGITAAGVAAFDAYKKQLMELL